MERMEGKVIPIRAGRKERGEEAIERRDMREEVMKNSLVA